jgi:hypothetical protein
MTHPTERRQCKRCGRKLRHSRHAEGKTLCNVCRHGHVCACCGEPTASGSPCPACRKMLRTIERIRDPHHCLALCPEAQARIPIYARRAAAGQPLFEEEE